MQDSEAKTMSIAPPVLHLVPLAILVAALCTGVFYVVEGAVTASSAEVALSVGVLGLGATLLFGPSRLILTLVFVGAILSHQFRSPIVVPFAGVEWHPRELLLLLLLAHVVVKVWQRRVRLDWSPLHLALLLYGAVFVYAAWRGLWLGNAMESVIAELRAPLFLLAFWAFVLGVRRDEDLFYYGYWALCVVTLLALATVAYGVYATLAGPFPNTQNALGEFVPRVVGATVIQSVRPSGHAWLEAGLVLCVGMFFCPREPWFRRTLYVGLGLLFAAAIAFGMMRTALVSVGVSVLVLAWLNMPRVLKGLSLGLVALVVFLGVLVLAQNDLARWLVGDASLTARSVEYTGALQAMKAHSFFGAGLGASFEALGLATPSSADSAIPTAYDSLHNSWLYVAWKGGLVGLAVLVLALVGLLLYSTRITRQLPTMNQRCFARALQAVLIGQLVASCTMPRLTYANGALFLALWTMAFVLLERGNGARGPRDDDPQKDWGEFHEEHLIERPPVAVSPTLEQL